MKKYLSIETIYKIFVVLAVSVIVFALNSEVFAEGNPTEGNPIKSAKIWTDANEFEIYQFNEAQFLTRISNKTLVNEFLWLCDNSIYMPTIQNWHKFIHNYKSFQNAQKAIRQGFSVELDDILN